MKVELIDIEKGIYWFHCPACKCQHCYYVGEPLENGAQWKFNGDMNRPTFTPSLKLTWLGKNGKTEMCHINVTNGRIKYHSNCTHELKGKTIRMEEI